MGRKSQIPEIEQKIGMPLDKWLKIKIAQGVSPGDMAKEIGMSQSGLYAFINSAGLKDVLKSAQRQAKTEAKPGELKSEIEKYIDSKKIADRRPSTIVAISLILKNLLWWLEYTKRPGTLRTMTKATMEGFFLYLKEAQVRWGGKQPNERRPLSPAARKGYYKVILSFCNWGMKQDPPLWEKNPMAGIDAPKIGFRLPEDMEDEQIATLLHSFNLKQFEGLRDRALCEVLLETGMRLSGVASMRVSQFDWNTGNGRIVEKGNKERMMQIPPRTCELIRRYLPQREKRTSPENDRLWISDIGKGKGLQNQAIYEIVRKWGKIIPNVRIHPHLFRHIFARWCVERNMGILDIMYMGGWNSMDLVQHYASAYQAKMAWKKRAGASVVDDMLKKEGQDNEPTSPANEAKPT